MTFQFSAASEPLTTWGIDLSTTDASLYRNTLSAVEGNGDRIGGSV
jgi:hypothetical protein